MGDAFNASLAYCTIIKISINKNFLLIWEMYMLFKKRRDSQVFYIIMTPKYSLIKNKVE